MNIDFPESTAANCWMLENPDASIGVDKSTGWIRSMRFKARGLDLFRMTTQDIAGHLGYLRVYDELESRWWHDLMDPSQISQITQRPNEIEFTKQFAGAPFILSVRLAMSGAGLDWEVKAVKSDKTVADRGLRVGFNLPMQPKWMVWAPCATGEFLFDGVDGFNFDHVQVSYISRRNVILPMVSHYHSDLDIGYTMIEPLDAKTPAARFQFSSGEKMFNWGFMPKRLTSQPTLEAQNYFIGLIGDRPMKTAVRVLFHEGDWRPAVGQVYQQYRSFFDPDSPAIYEDEGVFDCGAVDHGDDPQPYLDLGLKTLEVHGHFSYYSDYFYAGQDRWCKLNALEAIHLRSRGTSHEFHAAETWQAVQHETPQRIAELAYGPEWRSKNPDAETLCFESRPRVKKLLEKIEAANIRAFWYFNYTDGFQPVVEKKFPDSICRDFRGNYEPSGWMMCHNMNADLSYSYGKFLLDSAKKIIDTYPTLHGFFLDCFRHFEIDFAHDDGTTVVANRPAYSINFSYDGITKAIRDYMRSKKPMSLFANKPQTIRSMRYVDGVLLEGDGDMAEEKYFWACIAKPMFFMWTTNASDLDEKLRRSVLHGSFPRLVKALTDEEQTINVARYRRYRPLYEQFPRRVLCFEPDPLRVPRGSVGKLYTVADGYVASVVDTHFGEGDRRTWKKTPFAIFRVKRGHDVGRVGIIYSGETQMRDVDFAFNGTMIAVPLRDYQNCAVVKLFVTGNSQKAIGPGKFSGAIDFCGDPEASFSDLPK